MKLVCCNERIVKIYFNQQSCQREGYMKTLNVAMYGLNLITTTVTCVITV